MLLSVPPSNPSPSAWPAHQAAFVTTHCSVVIAAGKGDSLGATDALEKPCGSFYGVTSSGGTNRAGTVFKISATGTLTTLYSFTAGDDGSEPATTLVQGSDDSFYGTTRGPGSSKSGTVFKISTEGVLTTLYAFSGGLDGAIPEAPLVQGRDGSFYGTTYFGGLGGAGTIFRLTMVGGPQLATFSFGPSVILTWPTNYADFTLQSTTNLGPSAIWTTVSLAPVVVVNGRNMVTNSISGTHQFFRLSQ